jgi:Methyltransferase domain
VTAAGFDPYSHDPDRWGVSLAHAAELMLPCLDAAGARSVVEIGAFAGDLTRVLLDWAAGGGATVTAVDPAPQPGLEALARERPGLELVRETSLAALPQRPLPGAIVIDGDHNWWTVSEELRLVAERAAGGELPLLLFHDVSWPHARRDDYYDAAQIPADARHPVVGDSGGIFPGDPGVRRDGGLPYPRSAAHEGGPRNGVLTAVEDFVAAHDGLRLVVVPVFFGFGVVWSLDAPWSDAVARILDPWDRNPLLERLEANRVHQLALRQSHLIELWRLRERQARQEAVLRRMLESSAFGVAERLSRLRVRAGIAPEQSVVSKDEIRRALG